MFKYLETHLNPIKTRCIRCVHFDLNIADNRIFYTKQGFKNFEMKFFFPVNSRKWILIFFKLKSSQNTLHTKCLTVKHVFHKNKSHNISHRFQGDRCTLTVLWDRSKNFRNKKRMQGWTQDLNEGGGQDFLGTKLKD